MTPGRFGIAKGRIGGEVVVKRPTVDVKEWRGGGKRSGLEFGKLAKGEGRERGRERSQRRGLSVEVVIKGEDDRKAWARRRRSGWVLEGGWV